MSTFLILPHIWLLAVIFVPLIGSIAYFIIGRKQKIKHGGA
ncbi:MAG: PLDc N-terminal domain-containing protein [Nitrospirota bacterium]